MHGARNRRYPLFSSSPVSSVGDISDDEKEEDEGQEEMRGWSGNETGIPVKQWIGSSVSRVSRIQTA